MIIHLTIILDDNYLKISDAFQNSALTGGNGNKKETLMKERTNVQISFQVVRKKVIDSLDSHSPACLLFTLLFLFLFLTYHLGF